MPTKRQTAKALEGSIEKWRKIVAGDGVDRAHSNCPLCKLFAPAYTDGKDCAECPVQKSSGHGFCSETPFVNWTRHQICKHGKQPLNKVHCGTCTRLAKAELEFLESLREEGK